MLSLGICTTLLQNQCLQSNWPEFYPMSSWKPNKSIFYDRQPPGIRFLSSSTAPSPEGEDIAEDLLKKLIHRKLLGPTLQVQDMNPSGLPLRELPPGNTASLFLMYLAWCRVSCNDPCSKSTFYTAAKSWYACLRFRRRSEHAMCATCQRLKAAIHQASESILVVRGNPKTFDVGSQVRCMHILEIKHWLGYKTTMMDNAL